MWAAHHDKTLVWVSKMNNINTLLSRKNVHTFKTDKVKAEARNSSHLPLSLSHCLRVPSTTLGLGSWIYVKCSRLCYLHIDKHKTKASRGLVLGITAREKRLGIIILLQRGVLGFLTKLENQRTKNSWFNAGLMRILYAYYFFLRKASCLSSLIYLIA
jgi:hypothetical protein